MIKWGLIMRSFLLVRNRFFLTILITMIQLVAISSVYAFALPDSDGSKAKRFEEIFVTEGRVYKQSASADFFRVNFNNNMSHEKLIDFARHMVRLKLAKEYNTKVYNSRLGLDASMFYVSTETIPLEMIEEKQETVKNKGKEYTQWVFSFREKPIDTNAFNPFIEKNIPQKPAVIQKVTQEDDGLKIEAEGYGYYESAENIDKKASFSANIARQSVFDLVTSKVVELGIIDEAKSEDFKKELQKKKRLGGIYDPTGCGVYFRKPLSVKINNNGEILDPQR